MAFCSGGALPRIYPPVVACAPLGQHGLQYIVRGCAGACVNSCVLAPAETVKKLNRENARLDTLRKNLIQQLHDDDEVGTEGLVWTLTLQQATHQPP